MDRLEARAAAPEADARAPRRLPMAEAKVPRKPADWRWQVRHAVTSVEALERALPLTEDERRGALRAESQGLPISITPYYMGLVDPKDPGCPIRRQCVPVGRESVEAPGDLRDPLGEEEHEVAPRLVQRYPDRALLLATDRCAVYCRFCTRSRMVGDGGGAASLEALGPALAHLRAHPEIRDVIVSGGDPLAMATDRLVRIVAALREIPSLDTIRLATRVPVTLPMRVTAELVRALRPYHPLWVMTHFNHPREGLHGSKAVHDYPYFHNNKLSYCLFIHYFAISTIRPIAPPHPAPIHSKEY
jgi:lysine 2,3-aminomutase